MDNARAESEIFTGIGVIAVIACAGLLSTIDGHLGQVNVALILAIVVAAAAAGGGRLAGATTGLTAAISYNFFHTEPTHSLRIDHARDVITVVLLATIGVVVGELSRQRYRSLWIAKRSSLGLNRVLRVAQLAAEGADSETLIAATENEIRLELRLAEARFELGGVAGEERPIIDDRGVIHAPLRLFLDEGFALPAEGADLPVSYRGRDFGRLVLRPQHPVGIPGEQLRCAVAIADQLAAAMATMVR